MSAAEIVARLHRVVAGMVEHGGSDELWFADAMQLYLRADISLDAVLGLPGGWRAHLRHRSLIEVLRQIMLAMPRTSHRATARALHQQLVRYAETQWRADRATGRRPHGPKGRLFDLLCIVGEPPSQERLRKLLSEAWAANSKDMTRGAA